MIGADRLPLTDLSTAFMLLTRLPVARFAQPGGPDHLARCVWAFPIVGLVINGLGGLVYWLAYRFGMPPLLAAAWAMAAMMIATGGLHEDGLADTADGFGGGATPARKLEIMRDSRIGSYGALALLMSVIVRAAAIAALYQPATVVPALILAGMLGRSGILLMILTIRPARVDGMGAAMHTSQTGSALLGMVFGVAASLLLAPLQPAIAAILLGCGAALTVAKFAHRQIGGYTGDVLGAGEVIAECVVLTVIVCISTSLPA
jgi:adenosylcobinamide-GDP ribazoletransferase